MSIFMECDEAANQVSMVDPDAGKLTYEYAAEGDKVFDASYDAWGNQTVAKNDIGFHRGYIGHEHLNEFGLINMNGRPLSPSGESNGRLYDSPLGRLLSSDACMQTPDNSRSLGRNCLDNPLGL